MNPLSQQVTQALAIPGLSPDGSAWMAKALHPSDAVGVVNGIPTLEAVPSASLNFMSTATITAPAAATWSAQINMQPSPLYFAKVACTDGAAFSSTTICNTSLGVADPWSEFGANARAWNASALAAWSANTTAFRLTYAAATVSLAASATTNEGAIVVAQYELRGRKVKYPQYNLTAATAPAYAMTTVRNWPTSRPTASILQAMPGAIQWEARKGCYAVLKLDGGFADWHGSRDTVANVAYTTLPVVSESRYDAVTNAFDAPGAVAASATDVPFGPQGVWSLPASQGTGATSISRFNTVVATYPPSTHNSCVALLSGLDAQASLVVTVRVGFEVIVPPTSIYIGQVGSPVMYDPVALASYFRISREMLAAYPADYNVFGALFNVIKGVAGKVIPKAAQYAGKVLGFGTPKQVAPPVADSPGTSATNYVVTSPARQSQAPEIRYVDRPPPRRESVLRRVAKRFKKRKRRN